MTAAVEIADLRVRFGGINVLNGVSFTVAEGARHLLFGPNGAGKTTLLRVLCGEVPSYTGTVRLIGRDMAGLAPWERVRVGIGRTFQVTQLFDSLTVLDNVLLAVLADRRDRFRPIRPVRRLEGPRAAAFAVLDRFGVGELADRRVAALGYGEQRIVELAVTAAMSPRLLLLDEPTAGLSLEAAERFVEHVQLLPASVTVLFIDHDMDVAFRLARTATALANGEVVAHGDVEDVRRDDAVRELYLAGVAGV